jgi:GR25 family glycosyltransferase involved in LPS biosynthesis
MQKIPVFVISLKKSPRVNILKKRLKNIKINYKIFNAINGKKLEIEKKLYLIYSKKQTIKNIGRDLTPPEIGAAASHLAIYNYIIKKNINQAIVMEDDAYPSRLLYDWIKNNITVGNNEILSFYSAPSNSFIKKKPKKIILKKKIGIHSFVTHAYNSSCYQINNFTCKKIIKLTKNKVIGLPDWPFLINKDYIELSVTIPFISAPNDRGISYLKTERNKLLKKNISIKKIIPKKIISFLRYFYYLSYLAFFFMKTSKDFYYEHFFQKYFFKVVNFFTKKYLETNKIFFDEKYYYHDIQKITKNYEKRFILN